jgi:hypothetical protein
VGKGGEEGGGREVWERRPAFPLHTMPFPSCIQSSAYDVSQAPSIHPLLQPVSPLLPSHLGQQLPRSAVAHDDDVISQPLSKALTTTLLQPVSPLFPSHLGQQLPRSAVAHDDDVVSQLLSKALTTTLLQPVRPLFPSHLGQQLPRSAIAHDDDVVSQLLGLLLLGLQRLGVTLVGQWPRECGVRVCMRARH